MQWRPSHKSKKSFKKAGLKERMWTIEKKKKLINSYSMIGGNNFDQSSQAKKQHSVIVNQLFK